MSRLIFVTLFLLPLFSNAQYSQSDPFEKVEIPQDKDDFVSILNFWKQFNSVQIADLLQLDSILFYKDDTLKYRYYIADLEFFQKSMALADSALRVSTDSVYNKGLNSFDSYFTDIEKNRCLDNRKYLNKNGMYFKAEQFSEGNIAVVTNWLFDKKNNIMKETNQFIVDSSTYEMSYRREESKISQRYAKVKGKRFEYEYIIDYDKKGRIIKYSYSNFNSKNEKQESDSINVERGKDNLTRKIDGMVNNKLISFVFSYSGNTIQIIRQTHYGPSTFKLVVF